MRLVNYMFGAALLAAGSAAAEPLPLPRWNPRAPENSQMLPAFSYAALEQVLASIGASHHRAAQGPKGRILVTFPNKRKATLVLGACNAEFSACKALSIQSYWTPIAGDSAERTSKAVQAFNQRYSFGKAFVAADGRPALQRYLTADYGFVRGNLAVNLLVFSNQAERFAAEVLQPLETADRQP